jgi:hypothetical protein
MLVLHDYCTNPINLMHTVTCDQFDKILVSLHHRGRCDCLRILSNIGVPLLSIYNLKCFIELILKLLESLRGKKNQILIKRDAKFAPLQTDLVVLLLACVTCDSSEFC